MLQWHIVGTQVTASRDLRCTTHGYICGAAFDRQNTKWSLTPLSRLAGTLAAGQIQGDREYQEDSYGIFEVEAASPEKAGHALLVLADGMGGHAGGSRASQIVTQAFGEIYQETNGSVGERLRSSLDGTNQAIADEVGEHPEYSGMGSTLVAVVITTQGIQWLSVGDSLLWKLDASGNLQRLNADHSMAPVLQVDQKQKPGQDNTTIMLFAAERDR